MFENLACWQTYICRLGIMISLLLAHRGYSDTFVSDTFVDGNDDGWVRYNPLASQGNGATYSFPPVQTPLGTDHRYRIEAEASSNPEVNGPARVGSFRFDTSPAAAGTTWVVTGWDATKNQTFGAFAGVHFEQDNTFDGFGFTYSTLGSLDILRMDNGVSSVLASTPITLDSAAVYRFVFATTAGGGLRGFLFQAPDLVTPLVDFEVIDRDFVNGASGLYLFANDPSSGVGATFDNFSVGIVPEPSILSILALGGLCAFWAGRSRINR